MNKKSSYNNRLDQARSLQKRGLYQEALEIFEALRKEHPDKPEPIFGAGVCLFSLNEHTQSLGCFIKASELEPENPENFIYMGHCLVSSNQNGIAIKQYEKALKLDDNNFQALSELGRLYSSRERNADAVEVLKKAVAIKPSNAGNQAALALALAKIGDFEEAIKHANKAIRLEPKNLYGYFIMGHVHLIHGNQDESDKFFNKVIDIDPYYAPAFTAKTTQKITAKDHALLNKMEKALNQGMSAIDRQMFLYALGKAYNDIKETEKAFTYIRKANELNDSDFNSKAHGRSIRRLKKFFNKQFFTSLQYPSTTTYTPIFIVGMPRSGSTLVDQILSTHSAVYSGGESMALFDTISEIKDDTNNKSKYPTCLNEFKQSDIEKYRNAYIQKIAPDVNNVTHVVDKNLFNHENLGLIAMLFPDAKIIHTKRHPLDSGFSCYMTHFAIGLTWTNDLESIGKYYRTYIDLMDHWHTTLPISILDVQYEEMVADPVTNVRRMLDFCGLEWEDACLDFYKSKRSVNTASIWQVRQPVYKGSVQRWIPYAKHLQPLILALGDLLESDYEKLESLGIKHGPHHNNPLNKILKLFK